MTEVAPPQEGKRPSIHLYKEYGVFKVPGVSIVSAPTWEEAQKLLDAQNFGGNFVVLPELITVAGKDLSRVWDYEEDVKKTLVDFSEFTRKHPGATFVIGSPEFDEYYTEVAEKPFNSAFVIKDGQTLAVAHKRLPALNEERSFRMDSSQSTVTVGDANILICKDTWGATLQIDDPIERESFLKILTGSSRDAANLMSVQFVSPTAKRILVPAFWGIGMSAKHVNTQEEFDSYYEDNLVYTVESIFKVNPNIQQIVVADRASAQPPTIQDRLASKPMSLVATR